MFEKKMYELELLGSFYTEDERRINRVPGGWVFETEVSCCFIPYSEEFKIGKEK